MQVFLVLLLIDISGGGYQVQLAPVPTMEKCLKVKSEMQKMIPAQHGISFVLECITPKATDGMDV